MKKDKKLPAYMVKALTHMLTKALSIWWVGGGFLYTQRSAALKQLSEHKMKLFFLRLLFSEEKKDS